MSRGCLCSVAGLIILLALRANAAPTRLVLLLTTPGETTPVRPETLLLSLSLQLDPYRIRTRHEIVSWPGALGSQIALARERGQLAGALAVVWYAEESAAHSVVVHVLDLREEQPVIHSLALGRPGAGIERSIALAVRTLLRARPLEIERASRPASHPVPRPTAPERPSPPPPLLQVGAGYAVDGFPLGQDLRHGPELALSFQIRWLRGRVVVGYRVPKSWRDAGSEWSRSVWCVSFVAAAPLLRGDRWELVGGPRLGFGAVRVQARALDAPREEEGSLEELSLGAELGARVRLGYRLEATLSGILAGLPLAQSLSVRGREVLRSGRLQLALGAGIALGFF